MSDGDVPLIPKTKEPNWCKDVALPFCGALLASVVLMIGLGSCLLYFACYTTDPHDPRLPVSVNTTNVKQDKLCERPWKYAFFWQVWATIATIFAIVDSFHHIYQHFQYRDKHGEDAFWCVIQILLVVPVYGALSCASFWVAMGAKGWATPLAALRELYEAVVLLAFVQFVADIWGGAKHLAVKVADEKLTVGTVFKTWVKTVSNIFACCLRRTNRKIGNIRVFPWGVAPGSDFVFQTFVGILQYALAMTLYVIISFAVWYAVPDRRLQDMITTVLHGVKILSNLFAMYNLVILYEYLIESELTNQKMKSITPHSKFLCIKLIIIFSLWQEFIVKQLVHHDLLPSMEGLSEHYSHHHDIHRERLGECIVNFLVCFEMLIFAPWHRIAYPYDQDWEASTSEGTPHSTVKRRWWFFVSLPRLLHDLRFLVRKVRSQKKAIELLRRACDDEKVNLCKDPNFEEHFKRFDLDENQRASKAQLQYWLAHFRFCTWEAAEQDLTQVDEDGDQRISYDEMLALPKVRRANNPRPV